MPKKFGDLKIDKPAPVPIPNSGSPHFPPDDELPPWLVEEFLHLVRPLAASTDATHLTAVLPYLSAIVGPRAFYRYGGLEVRPSVFGLILGPSTVSAKSSAAKLAQTFTIGPLVKELDANFTEAVVQWKSEKAAWERADKGDRGPSPQKPLRQYLRAPNDVTLSALHHCLIAQDALPESERFGMVQYHDEFATLLKSSGSQFNLGLIERLTSLFDCAPIDLKRATGGTDGDGLDVRIEEPFLSLLGCSTPQWLTDSITGSEVVGGFLARFFIYESTVRPSTARMPAATPPLPDTGRLEQWRERAGAVFEGQVQGEWVFETPALGLFEEFHRKVWETKILVDGEDSETRTPIAGRILANTKKLALLFEAFDCKGEPRRDAEGRALIGAPMMRCAIRVAEFYLAEMLRISGRTLAPWWEAAERRYLDFLADGPQRRSDCYQAVRSGLRRHGFKGKQFEELMASLETAEKIVVETPDKGGPEIHRLRTPEDDEADTETGSEESAVAQAAAVFREKPALSVVDGGSGAAETFEEAGS